MTSCDHGIALDRYCGTCEFDLLADQAEYPGDRNWSRLAVLVCIAAMCLIALYLGSGK